MKLLLICLVLVVCAVSAAKPFQLKSRLAKKMCAAGKSNWSTASGSGPCKSQLNLQKATSFVLTSHLNSNTSALHHEER